MGSLVIGLFVEEGDDQDLFEARPRTLDRARFDKGLHEAEALHLDYRGPFDTVHIVALREELTHAPMEELPLRNR